MVSVFEPVYVSAPSSYRSVLQDLRMKSLSALKTKVLRFLTKKPFVVEKKTVCGHSVRQAYQQPIYLSHNLRCPIKSIKESRRLSAACPQLPLFPLFPLFAV